TLANPSPCPVTPPIFTQGTSALETVAPTPQQYKILPSRPQSATEHLAMDVRAVEKLAHHLSDKFAAHGLTFDDVLIEPRYSTIVPTEVEVATHLTAAIPINIPILSSPMDTVTESAMAIALAQEGGLGVIHKNMSIERQTEEVDKVKRSANGIIEDPVTLPPD